MTHPNFPRNQKIGAWKKTDAQSKTNSKYNQPKEQSFGWQRSPDDRRSVRVDYPTWTSICLGLAFSALWR